MFTSVAPTRSASSWFNALWARFGTLIHELGKFGVVGAVAYVVDTTVFNLFLSGTGSLWAKVISTVFSASVAFVGNRFWTWRDRTRSGLRREYLLYFAFNVVGLLIGLACLWFSEDVLGYLWPAVFHTRLADNVSAQIVGTGLGTLFRFWSYRRFVFVRADPAGPAGGATPDAAGPTPEAAGSATAAAAPGAPGAVSEPDGTAARPGDPAR